MVTFMFFVGKLNRYPSNGMDELLHPLFYMHKITLPDVIISGGLCNLFNKPATGDLQNTL